MAARPLDLKDLALAPSTKDTPLAHVHLEHVDFVATSDLTSKACADGRSVNQPVSPWTSSGSWVTSKPHWDDSNRCLVVEGSAVGFKHMLACGSAAAAGNSGGRRPQGWRTPNTRACVVPLWGVAAGAYCWTKPQTSLDKRISKVLLDELVASVFAVNRP